MRALFFGLLLWKLHQSKRLLRKHNQMRISHWSTVPSVHVIDAFGTIIRIPAAWKNLEKKALSSLHKFLRNWLLEEEGEGTPLPPTHTLTRRFRNNLCKDDSTLFSWFLQAQRVSEQFLRAPSGFLIFYYGFRKHFWNWAHFYCHRSKQKLYISFLPKKATKELKKKRQRSYRNTDLTFETFQKIFISWHSPHAAKEWGKFFACHTEPSPCLVWHTHDKAIGWESHKAVIRALAGDS